MHLRSVDILAKDGFILAGIFHITLKRPCYVKKKKIFTKWPKKKILYMPGGWGSSPICPSHHETYPCMVITGASE